MPPLLPIAIAPDTSDHSNRVYPSAGNNLLTTLSIRTTIQEYLHQACTNRQKRNIRN